MEKEKGNYVSHVTQNIYSLTMASSIVAPMTLPLIDWLVREDLMRATAVVEVCGNLTDHSLSLSLLCACHRVIYCVMSHPFLLPSNPL